MKSYFTYLREQAISFLQKEVVIIPSRLYDGGAYPRMQTRNTTKEDFLVGVSRAALDEIIVKVNANYGLTQDIALSREEMCGVFYAEMGMRGSFIDPKYDHKNGEFGLLPLAKYHGNYTKVVNERPAPNPHSLYEVEINVQEFLLYFGGMRSHWKYGGYHNYPGIAGVPSKMTQLTAAIVHGYFYEGTYMAENGDFVMPTREEVLDGIVAEIPVTEILANTTYQYKSVLPSRVENLRAGIGLA